MTKTLRKGQRGPEVQRWQEFLAAQGFEVGTIDGIFGENVAVATRAFQSAQGLEADAVVGAKTLAAAGKLGFRLLRRLQNGELNPALIAQARIILAAHHTDPFGTEVPFEIEGVRYVGRIEQHYHPPGGPMKPWGYHVGVSLFVDMVPDTTVVAPDEVTERSVPAPPDDHAPVVVANLGTVVLDPGHGGAAPVGGSSQNNAHSPSGMLEKTLTLRMAQLVRDAVAARAPALRVELTRNSDVNLSLADRAHVARDAHADLFLSIHFNGYNGTARGVETLVRPKASGNVNYDEDRAFAARIQAAAHAALVELDPTTPSRGVKDQDLGVLRDENLGNNMAHAPCRACLLEVEFMDVPQVDRLFNTGPNAEAVRKRVADAIAQALIAELA
jgi:N-acetylmuramoyl-L-alanine amidase